MSGIKSTKLSPLVKLIFSVALLCGLSGCRPSNSPIIAQPQTLSFSSPIPFFIQTGIPSQQTSATPYIFSTEIEGVASYQSTPDSHPPNPENIVGKRIIFYGDSITTWGNNYSYSYPLYLQKYLEGVAEIIAMGKGGETSQYGLEHLDDVIRAQPDIIGLFWGMNDPGGGCLPETEIDYRIKRYEQNTNQQIEALIQHNKDIDILMMTVTPILGYMPSDINDPASRRCDYNSYLDRIAEIQRQIVVNYQGEGKNVYLIDVRKDFEDAFSMGGKLYSDIVHPGRDGSWQISKSVLRFFGFAPSEANPFK